MKIFGIDFTSAPSYKKPITCAVCDLQESLLTLGNVVLSEMSRSPEQCHPERQRRTSKGKNLLIANDCLKLPSFEEFEAFLRSHGPWIVALDFPFGLPRKLLTNLQWPQTWESYMQAISTTGKTMFEDALIRYQASRSVGDKQHLRATDVLAGARSPMMLHRVPVGKMFFQGATRLLASDVSILPCRPTKDNRIAVEGYPALVAHRWIGKLGYKSDERSKQTQDKLLARQSIVYGLRSAVILSEAKDPYGFSLEISDEIAEMCIQDPMGDCLDAFLCAIQAAWAYTRRDYGYGIPAHCDKDEGWIVDPFPLRKWRLARGNQR